MDISISSALMSPRVLLVLAKNERTVVLQNVLKQIGVESTFANNVFDAAKMAQQFLPHLLIVDSSLPDGKASLVFDRLKLNPFTAKIPIFINLLKKTPDELEQFKTRKPAGFTFERIDSANYVAQLQSFFKDKVKTSPFFMPIDQVEQNLTLKFTGQALGVNNNHLVVDSAIEFTPETRLVCLAQKFPNEPLVARAPISLKKNETIFSLFPREKMSGKGQKWIMALPEFSIPSDKKELAAPESSPSLSVGTRLLMFDSDETRANKFIEILREYEIEVEYARNLNSAASLLKSDPTSYKVVYLYELLAGANAIGWSKVFNGIPEGQRPTLIVGTTSQQTSNQSKGLIYLQRPFGLNTFVNTIQAIMGKGKDFKSMAATQKAEVMQLPVSLSIKVDLIGIDESGGVLRSSFGSQSLQQITLEGDIMSKLFGTATKVNITKRIKDPNNADFWQLRFDFLDQNQTSRLKQLEAISQKMGDPNKQAS